MLYFFLAVVLTGFCGPSVEELLSVHSQNKRKQDSPERFRAPYNPNFLIENNGDYFEGDLKISQEFIDAYLNDNSPSIQSITPTGLWPNSEYHYVCDESVDQTTKNLIMEGINIWNVSMGTCLNFIEGKSDSGYVQFTTSRHGCYSTAVGYQGSVVHLVSLENPNCTNLHTVLHEIGHTLGYWHEQSRPDRDKYVRINYFNVKRAYRTQLNKENTWGVSTNGMVYDYGSIMHYSQYAFTANGQMTISIVNMTEYERQGSPELGRGRNLSSIDIAALKRHYMCT